MKRNTRIVKKVIILIITLLFISLLFFNAEALTPDASFTIIVLPDTQHYIEGSGTPEMFTNQTQWIVNNRDSMNIQMVIHEGDIVENPNYNTQWQDANTSMSILDGIVPYSVLPGNHDYTKYNDYFPSSRYENETWWGGSYNRNNNSYQLLTIEGFDFIFLSLCWNPSSDEINWANSVLNNYPDRWAVLTTHGYLDDLTATREGIHGLPNNSAEYIWIDLVKNHKNLFLVLCGHEHDSGGDGEARRMDINDYGEEVHQLLANYQDYPKGGNGWLRILNITIYNNQKNEIDVKTYSPYLGEYTTDNSSRFTLLFDSVGATFPWTFPVTFRSGPCTTPVISSLANSTPMSTSVTITWTTNQSADSRVKYSKNSDLSNEEWSSWDNDTSSISIGLSGLDAETTYYYQAWSYNGTNSSCSVTEPISLPYKNFTTASSIWCNNDYSKKAPILINNTGGSEQTYYQVMLNYSYDSDMNTDFSDIRIYNETDCSLVPLWNESAVDGSWNKIWFNATNIPASSWCNNTYFLYYNNDTASSVSNGSTTFDFFDDWSDGDYTSNPTWIVSSGTWSAANYYLEKTSTGWEDIYTAFGSDEGIWEWKFSGLGGDPGNAHLIFFMSDDTSYTNAYFYYDNGGNIYLYKRINSVNTAIDSLAAGTPSAGWHNYKVTRDSSGAMKVYLNDVEKLSATNAEVSGSNYIILELYASGQKMDDIRVRKYASPEPSASVGSEESAPVATTPSISNVTTGSINATSQWVAWDVNQIAHNRWKYSLYSNMSFESWSAWDNSTASPNVTVSILTTNTKYYYQAWSYNATNTSLTDNSTTANFTTPIVDTTFTVSLPAGYIKLVFQPPNSTATNYPPNGQTDSQEFYNVTNSGNVNLDIRMQLNATISTITLKADADNNPAGADTIGTSLVTIYPSLAQGSSADIWLWSDFDHTPAQTANRTVYINVSES